MKKIMIIDGSSLLYRAFFALPPLNNALGIPTNAVYGFLTMLIKLYDQLKPEYVVVAFDKGKHTFRTELYNEYKANRDNAPQELSSQFALIREVLEAIGIRVIEEEGFEGDDIIGSLSKSLGSDELAVNIITGDRDTLQLVDDHSSVFLTKKGITEMLEVTKSNMADIYGYGPSQVIEMKSLMGDTADNIPGVPGVGEKTALKLLNEYGDLEHIYENLDAISGKKLKERLMENKELAFLSRVLATIKTDMDISYKMEDFVPAIHEQEVVPLFEKLGFHNLVPKLQAAFQFGDSAFGNLFSNLEATSTVDVTIKDGCELNPQTVTSKFIGLDIQVGGKEPFYTFESAYVSVEADDTVYEFLNSKPEHLEALQQILNEARLVATKDGKLLLETFGEDQPLHFKLVSDSDEVRLLDVTLAAYLLDPTRTNYGITYLCERFEEKVVSAKGGSQESAETALALLRMIKKVQVALKENKLDALYKDIELPLIHTLAVMEKNGIYIDPEALANMKERFVSEVKEKQQEIYTLAEEEFNINSPKQLGTILFEKLGLPVIKKTKTGYSTNAEVLDILKADHPIVEKILEYRTVAKLLSTYLEGMAPLINKRTHRIHSSFNQMVTATGRLSSSDPNLQNIPVRSEKGKQIRSLFLPAEGYRYLVSGDYSQIELRVLAHLSEDPALIKAFHDGMDIHRFTAAEVLGKNPSEVTALERSHAKAVNFGIVYGISDFGLARDLGISRNEAKEYIELYFSRYPQIKAYMDHMVAVAHETGSVRTIFGRVRSLSDINSRNFNRRSFAERTAMNTPIQGSAADIIKIAMNRVENWIQEQKLKSRLLLQVHDELVLEVTEEERTIVEENLKRIMESVVTLKVPLVVDVHSAENWALVK